MNGPTSQKRDVGPLFFDSETVGTFRHLFSMVKYSCGADFIDIEERKAASGDPHPALLLLHGSMGAGSYWLNRFGPSLDAVPAAAYAPRYFQKTRTLFATQKAIFDGKHFPAWLAAARDAVTFVAQQPGVDAQRVGVLGFSLGGFLAIALAAEDRRVRAVISLSGGMPPGWENHASNGMAPVLLLHGEKDPVVPVAETYKAQRQLQERGVHCEVEVYPGERHWMGEATHARVLTRCNAFLAQYL